jgi:hypothetical protein
MMIAMARKIMREQFPAEFNVLKQEAAAASSQRAKPKLHRSTTACSGMRSSPKKRASRRGAQPKRFGQ